MSKTQWTQHLRQTDFVCCVCHSCNVVWSCAWWWCGVVVSIALAIDKSQHWLSIRNVFTDLCLSQQAVWWYLNWEGCRKYAAITIVINWLPVYKTIKQSYITELWADADWSSAHAFRYYNIGMLICFKDQIYVRSFQNRTNLMYCCFFVLDTCYKVDGMPPAVRMTWCLAMVITVRFKILWQRTTHWRHVAWMIWSCSPSLILSHSQGVLFSLDIYCPLIQMMIHTYTYN